MTNLEYAIRCKEMQQDLTQEMIKDSHSLVPTVTIDNYESCRKYFQIVDFWNEQICKEMGWTHESNSTD